MSTTASEIDLKKRAWIYFVTFVVGLLLSLPGWSNELIGPGIFTVLAFFPIGLVRAFFGQSGSRITGPTLIAGGWMLYGIHAFITLQMKKPVVFYALYGVLLILLACNISGCHLLNQEMQGLH